MKTVHVEDLLAPAHRADFEAERAASWREPRRYVSWRADCCQLLVIDLDRGKPVRAWTAFLTREEAEAAVAELRGQVH